LCGIQAENETVRERDLRVTQDGEGRMRALFAPYQQKKPPGENPGGVCGVVV
jgi:hypothetical protein